MRNSLRRSVLIVLAVSLPVVSQNVGQSVAMRSRVTQARKTLPSSSLRINVRMVLIPVTVTDPVGAPVAGLPRQDFRLFEDGVEQKVTTFASEDAPVSLGVVFDASRSMDPKLDQSRAAVSGFFRTSMPGDEYFLVEFNDKPRILSTFTRDIPSLEASLARIRSENWTALLDAVYLSIRQMRHASNPRKALLILSDGADNNSRYTESELRSAVREADVCIYSIALVGHGFMNRHVRLLRQLSEETGGLTVQVQKPSELIPAVDRISDAIRHQYVLGYVPTNSANDELYRKIQVKLDQPAGPRKLRISWRTGYYAP